LQKYIYCDLLAFPTTYEGFGLPIIEAQAVGRPVLTSALSPMREVAGAGALLVDPYSASSIKEGLVNIIANDSLRNNIVNGGLENVKKYRLGEVTRQYLDLYKSLHNRKHLRARKS
jgi:glycosyltransferase involved in cell wall biosynthesis